MRVPSYFGGTKKGPSFGELPLRGSRALSGTCLLDITGSGAEVSLSGPASGFGFRNLGSGFRV